MRELRHQDGGTAGARQSRRVLGLYELPELQNSADLESQGGGRWTPHERPLKACQLRAFGRDVLHTISPSNPTCTGNRTTNAQYGTFANSSGRCSM